ncbi:MAG: DPP IV N-terminal domain-containing protein [Candidatus Poribacteria bacterium]|nr:DPP IV N-terminal domain-containing protein [Candidatus Poribacteria bacterium]
MKRTRTYVILGMALLLSMNLFTNSGWAAEAEIISFLPRGNDARSIHFIDTQGKLLQELMVDPGRIGSFSWSPDGRSIAHGSNQNGNPDIYVRDVRTNVERQLTFHDSRDIWPAWSPNGKWIAFISERDGEMDIYRMDADGANVKRLTNQGDCKKPAWSPDSQSIAFSASKKEAEIGSDIYVMSAEGKGLRQLADTSSGVCAWSPDGKEIAYIPPGDAVGGVALFSIDINGKNMRQLTRLYEGWTLITSPIWSPSGKWIAYILTEVREDLVERLLRGERIPADEVSANAVICIANTNDVGGGEPIEMPRGLVPGHLEWMPEGFLSVSLSAEKQITLWGALKQTEDTSQ